MAFELVLLDPLPLLPLLAPTPHLAQSPVPGHLQEGKANRDIASWDCHTKTIDPRWVNWGTAG